MRHAERSRYPAPAQNKVLVPTESFCSASPKEVLVVFVPHKIHKSFRKTSVLRASAFKQGRERNSGVQEQKSGVQEQKSGVQEHKLGEAALEDGPVLS